MTCSSSKLENGFFYVNPNFMHFITLLFYYIGFLSNLHHLIKKKIEENRYFSRKEKIKSL